ncbi:MAG: FAD-dependent oxidoreductase [Cyanobacteriota bacterium]|nr:FAD-dependent oxidoreductase [Cyanobacteriota bacterium]
MSGSLDAVDVLVWGGGTGAVAAGLQAARSGVSTLLLTPGGWLGGMVSAAGVCCPDGNELTPWQTGLWGALLRELNQLEPDGLDQNWVSCFGYRPISAETILQGWVQAEAKLQWWPHCQLLEVERLGARITAVRLLHNGRPTRVACRIVIDGSDRGDLLPLAQAPFRLGWEPQQQWSEPSAPSQERLDGESFFAQQPVQSPTWVVMGQLNAGPPSADLASPAVLPAPFEHACQRFGLERTITYGRLPGGLVMLNWPLEGNDWHTGLERAFSGDASAEAELFGAMQAHSLSFAKALMEASGGWLQLGEAFSPQAGSPAPWLAAMPYWREGRRLIGRHTVIEQELLPLSTATAMAPLPVDATGALQSIAIGNYANDHHYPGADWPLAAKSTHWGGRWTGTPFCIPYGALVSAAIDNLLAADKAFSTSHMANGATRLQPLILNVGQAAGAAAALALQSNRSPAEISVRSLQERLINDRCAPSAVAPCWDLPWHHPEWRAWQLACLDDPAACNGSGLSQAAVPAERHEQLWRGTLRDAGGGAFELELSGGVRWPVITLEPAMHHWLQQRSLPESVALIGCANPWGPWLRVSRSAG